MIKKSIFLLCLVLIEASLASQDFSKGEEVFNKFRCYNCHGDIGQRKALDVSEVIAGWEADKIVEALQEYRANTRDNYGYGAMMHTKVKKMYQTQMKDVAAYISSFKSSIVKNTTAQEEVSLEGFVDTNPIELTQKQIAMSQKQQDKKAIKEQVDNKPIELTVKQQDKKPIKEQVSNTPIKVIEKKQEVKYVDYATKKPVDNKEIKTIYKKLEFTKKQPDINFIDYTIKKGDTLSSIARSRYNNRIYWTVVYAMNKNLIKNKNVLPRNALFKIPKTLNLKNDSHVDLLTRSYMDIYTEYVCSNKSDDAVWLLYACYTFINPNVLDEYKDTIEPNDINKVKEYKKRFGK